MDENIFAMNMTLVIETPGKNYFSAPLLGWKKGEFLMTEALVVNGQPAKMQQGDLCTVRFLKDGNAYGFPAEALAVQLARPAVMFLAYPAKIDCMKVNVAPRYQIELPARLLDGSGALIAEASLVDISAGGCGLRIAPPPAAELAADGAYRLVFTLLSKELTIDCGIKKLDKRPDAVFLGVDFRDVAPDHKEILDKLLDALRKRAGG